MVRDTDTNQCLPTDLITEEGAATYQVPEQGGQVPDDDAETISSMSTANYDWEEVETSLTSIAEAFHTIAQEYEKLTSTVPHMSKVQAAQVIARLPILPALKQELKAEKIETAKTTEMEPVPGTSQEPKEINYRNLVILITVGDYVVNKAKNIKEVAKKWGLSFSMVQHTMSHKKEYSIDGRQYSKRKRVAEKQEGSAKKSQQLEEKWTMEPARAKSPQPAEQS